MKQPASSQDPVLEEAKTATEASIKKPFTDRELVVVFITFKKKYTFYKSAGKTIFEFLLGDIQDLLIKWQSHEPISVPDIRDVFEAMKSFNSATRD